MSTSSFHTTLTSPRTLNSFAEPQLQPAGCPETVSSDPTAAAPRNGGTPKNFSQPDSEFDSGWGSEPADLAAAAAATPRGPPGPPGPPSTDAANAANAADPEADAAAGNEYDLYESFDAMGLRDTILRGIFGYGLEKPSAIQQKAIVPAAVHGRDVLMHAQSGTGKTACFSVGVLNRIDSTLDATQALILSPTRDLALQTHKVLRALGDYDGITVHASIGGRGGRADGEMLRRNPHVVSATPGRILDNINRGNISMRGIKTLVLDEVDVMLSADFRDSMYDIVRALPSDTQILLASATYTQEVHEVADKILNTPVKVVIPQADVTLTGIKQFYVDCGADHHKFDVLLDLYQTLSLSQSVIFVNSRRKAMELADELDRQDHTVSVIHGEMSQDDRESTLSEFTQGASRVLVATDIIARGIDVQQVSVVVNYELPRSRENYIHRIGRGGRFGRKAVTVNLINGGDQDVRTLRDLEQYWSADISEMPNNVLDYLS